MYYIEMHSGTPQAYIITTLDPTLWPEGRRLSAAVGKAKLKAKAIESLAKALKPGDTVYCILRNVSRSGMSRQIDFMITGEDGKPWTISPLVAQALDYPQADGGALKVSGCGMDMGFSVVYNLGRALFPEGFIPAKAGKKYGRNGTNARARDTDGGYALTHSWL